MYLVYLGIWFHYLNLILLDTLLILVMNVSVCLSIIISLVLVFFVWCCMTVMIVFDTGADNIDVEGDLATS